MRVLPFADGGDQVLPKVFPVEMASFRKRERHPEGLPLPVLGEAQFGIDPRRGIVMTHHAGHREVLECCLHRLASCWQRTASTDDLSTRWFNSGDPHH